MAPSIQSCPGVPLIASMSGTSIYQSNFPPNGDFKANCMVAVLEARRGDMNTSADRKSFGSQPMVAEERRSQRVKIRIPSKLRYEVGGKQNTVEANTIVVNNHGGQAACAHSLELSGGWRNPLSGITQTIHPTSRCSGPRRFTLLGTARS